MKGHVAIKHPIPPDTIADACKEILDDHDRNAVVTPHTYPDTISYGKEGSDKDAERSLFNAAGNGDVRAQEELGRRYRISIWCKNDLEPLSHLLLKQLF